jgi:hypothetical protein
MVPLRGLSTIRVKFQVAATNVLKLVELARLSQVDFRSGFGTVFQDVRRVFTLSGDRWVARAKSTHLARSSQHQARQPLMLQHNLKQAVSGPNDLRELFVLIPQGGYFGMKVYDKPTRMSWWLLRLVAIRELLPIHQRLEDFPRFNPTTSLVGMSFNFNEI